MHIHETAARSGLDWLHAVEPLAYIAEESAVVMEFMSQRSVKHRLLNLGVTARSASARDVVATIGYRVGRWLREYQSTPWTEGPRHGRPETLAAALDKLDELRTYLATQGVDADLLAAVVDRATSAAGEITEPWTLVPCHGDLSPRNVLFQDPGDLWVIDPMPRWSVPPWEDLARFRFEAQVLLESRYPTPLGGAQLGALLGRELVRGYTGDDAERGQHCVLVEALVLLDGWCALAARRASTRRETGTRSAIKNRMHSTALHRISRDWVSETSPSGGAP
jgi:aminoglycoside phosphotransferase (APT) family kinase protein